MLTVATWATWRVSYLAAGSNAPVHSDATAKLSNVIGSLTFGEPSALTPDPQDGGCAFGAGPFAAFPHQVQLRGVPRAVS